MKKTIKIVGLCCALALVAVGIYVLLSPKTLDFRGTVTKIETTEQGTVFYISTPSVGTAYTVVASERTKVKPCHKGDPAIGVADIRVGDTIEGDYRWLTKEKEAKYITVWCRTD